MQLTNNPPSSSGAPVSESFGIFIERSRSIHRVYKILTAFTTYHSAWKGWRGGGRSHSLLYLKYNFPLQGRFHVLGGMDVTIVNWYIGVGMGWEATLHNLVTPIFSSVPIFQLNESAGDLRDLCRSISLNLSQQHQLLKVPPWPGLFIFVNLKQQFWS